MIEHLNTTFKRSTLCAVFSAIVALGLTIPCGVAFAEPQTSAEAEAAAEAQLEKVEELNEQAEIDAEAYNEAVVLKNEAEAASAKAKKAQQKAEKKVEKAKKKIAEKTAQIENLQAKLAERARTMYRSGGTNFLDVIVGSSSFEEFATTWSMLELLNQNDADLVSETKVVREELEEAKVELEEQAEEAEKQAKKAAEKAAEAKKQAAVAAEAKNKSQAAADRAQAAYDSLSEKAKELKEKEEAEAAAAAAAAEEAARAEQAAAASAENSASSASSASSANNGKSQSVSGSSVVSRAYSQLGKPYVWGATGMSSFDCSGLVGYCLKGSTGRWMTSGTAAGWTRVSNPQPGDICVRSGHVGVYIGGGLMIHAPHSGDVVKISTVPSNMYYVRY